MSGYMQFPVRPGPGQQQGQQYAALPVRPGPAPQPQLIGGQYAALPVRPGLVQEPLPYMGGQYAALPVRPAPQPAPMSHYSVAMVGPAAGHNHHHHYPEVRIILENGVPITVRRDRILRQAVDLPAGQEAPQENYNGVYCPVMKDGEVYYQRVVQMDMPAGC